MVDTTLAMKQSDVEHELISRSAFVVADIRRTTDLLIRADSPRWKYGNYGDREAELARRRKSGSDGVVVEVDGLVDLLNGFAVWARDPLSAPSEEDAIGAPYRPAFASTGGRPALFEHDPAALVRGPR